MVKSFTGLVVDLNPWFSELFFPSTDDLSNQFISGGVSLLVLPELFPVSVVWLAKVRP